MLFQTPGFTTVEDIANRALQHCGANRIASITESSKNAREVAACYAKLRQAELRRNNWKFAIQRAVLRPITTTTQQWTPPTYAAGTTYGIGEVTFYDDGFGARLYRSLVATNLGNTPSTTTAWENYFGPVVGDTWDSGTTYYAGDLAIVSTTIYLSLINANTALTSDTASWAAQAGTLAALEILYPLSAGPLSQSTTHNAYPLPYGFLRKTYQNPKQGSVTFLGAPSGRFYDDWLIENNFIITTENAPIVFRFIADVTNIASMDPMFCEGFAARIALEICDIVTQSQEQLRSVTAEYQKFMTEARVVDGIESEADEAPMDSYLAVRY